jgi:L-ascorbate metabolism protein UlaG (beta-lactamase superfamily)
MRIKDVTLEFYGHASIVYTFGTLRVAVDPIRIPLGTKPVDVIVVTQSHQSHCSVDDIQKLLKPQTAILCAKTVPVRLTKIPLRHIRVVYDKSQIKIGPLVFTFVASFSALEDRSLQDVGFIVTYGDTALYHVGDSDKHEGMHIVEPMHKKGYFFITALSVSEKYALSVSKAVALAKFLKTDVAIPIHYGLIEDESQAKAFVKKANEEQVVAYFVPQILSPSQPIPKLS